MAGLDSAAPIDASALPAEVRAASPKDQKLYTSALAFERVLVNQLATSMASSAGLGQSAGGDGEDAADGGSSSGGGPYAQMLPGALADGVMSGGGLGLAENLWRSLRTKAAA